MATNYNARIATRGLALSVDAANPASLPTNIRRNVLTNPETFDNVLWGKDNCTVISNTILAPDGTLTADTMVSTITGGTNTAFLNQAPTGFLNNTVYTFSVYLKRGTSPTSLVDFYVNTPYTEVTALVTWSAIPTISYGFGGAATAATLLASQFTNAGNDWYRVALTMSTGAGTAFTCRVYVRSQAANNIAGETVNVWGAQLEPGSSASQYYPVSTPDSNLNTRWNDLTGTSRLITTAIQGSGQIEYTTAGTYSFLVPVGITSISVVAVGGGAAAAITGSGVGGDPRSIGGGGGALAWKNNIPVVENQTVSVVVGTGGLVDRQNGGDSYISVGGVIYAGAGGGKTAVPGAYPSNAVPAELAGTRFGIFDGGGNGGAPGVGNSPRSGGGAGGYTADAGTGLGGSAGHGFGDGIVGSGGGGVGILGSGASGANSSSVTEGGGGGSGGTTGFGGVAGTRSGAGGGYGGGGGVEDQATKFAPVTGGGGAVRIIWGVGRSYPVAANNIIPVPSTTISTNVSYGSFVNVTTPILYDSRNSGALVFNNLDNYVAMPELSSQTNSPLSVFAWVFLNATPVGTKGIWGYYGVNNNNCHFEINPTATRLRLGDINKSDLPMLAIGSWQFIGFTSTGTAHSYYVNGVLSATWSGATGTILGSNGTFPSSHDIGRSDAGRVWNGRIAHVTIYNAELTAAEVLNNFNALRGRYAV